MMPIDEQKDDVREEEFDEIVADAMHENQIDKQ